VIQYSLALIYGPYVLLSFYIFPPSDAPCWRRRFNESLDKGLPVALWSQLLYSLTIVVACVVRRHQSTLQAYEAAIIVFVIEINVLSFHMTLTAHFKRIDRLALLISVAVITSILAIYAQSSPPLEQQRHWKSQQACLVRESRRTYFHRRVPGLILACVVIAFTDAAWAYVYYKGPGYRPLYWDKWRMRIVSRLLFLTRHLNG
jgi:hypothetical protein